jgi:RNase P protein component
LIKRRMRESFRLQQQLLGPSFSGIGYFIYNDKKVKSSQEIYAAFTHLLTNWKNSDT